MNIEQRLTTALRNIDHIEPSPDLWDRVVHSIEEERQHRRRIVATAGAIAATLMAVLVVAAVGSRPSVHGRYVDRPTMEVLETVVLGILVIALGPAISRFGRGFAADLWPVGSATPPTLLRLLDLAYFLVFSGYILLTTEFEFGDSFRFVTLADQIGDAAHRIGGLLLLVGALHAITIAVLPVVALIDNSTRARTPLPRWMIVVGVIVAIQTLPGLPLLLIALVGDG